MQQKNIEPENNLLSSNDIQDINQQEEQEALLANKRIAFEKSKKYIMEEIERGARLTKHRLRV